MNTNSGIAFMSQFNQFYYSFSPFVADLERENPVFQDAVRLFITPMISTLSIMTLAEDGNDAQVLFLGSFIIAVNLILYAGIPAMIGFSIHKKIKIKLHF